MKKVFLGVAAVAMLGLAACANKEKEAVDSAIDSADFDTVVVVADSINVESIAPDSALVSETVEAAAAVVPAGN